MAFRKLGLVFDPRGRADWMVSHAQLPTALSLPDGRHRIYFATRAADGFSRIGFVEMDVSRPGEIGRVSSDPVLVPGPPGRFDQHGVFPCSLVRDGDRIYLYYAGWLRGDPPPLFYAAIGLAVSTDGGETFERMSPAPILDRSEHDPCLVTSPCVIRIGDGWRMYYTSGVEWVATAGGLESRYHVKIAESADGKRWERSGRVAIDFLDEGETNVARPAVMFADGRFRMWFCRVRPPEGYRLGYAESADGLVWERMDERAGLTVSEDGFDGGMVAYPNVLERDGLTYLLYNGDGFGREGFGLGLVRK